MYLEDVYFLYFCSKFTIHDLFFTQPSLPVSQTEHIKYVIFGAVLSVTIIDKYIYN